MNTVASMLDRSISGHGCVVDVTGPPGIGKSRLVYEATALARRRGAEVFSTFCESHAADIPFHVVARLLRDVAGIADVDDEMARQLVRAQVPDGSDEDLLLLNDLLGIRDPDVSLPNIDPDARRRRLTALINSVSLARTEPVGLRDRGCALDRRGQRVDVRRLSDRDSADTFGGVDHLPPRVRGSADADARCTDDFAGTPDGRRDHGSCSMSCWEPTPRSPRSGR